MGDCWGVPVGSRVGIPNDRVRLAKASQEASKGVPKGMFCKPPIFIFVFYLMTNNQNPKVLVLTVRARPVPVFRWGSPRILPHPHHIRWNLPGFLPPLSSSSFLSPPLPPSFSLPSSPPSSSFSLPSSPPPPCYGHTHL